MCEKEYVSMYVFVCERACMCECVCLCVSLSVCVREREDVYVWESVCVCDGGVRVWMLVHNMTCVKVRELLPGLSSPSASLSQELSVLLLRSVFMRLGQSSSLCSPSVGHYQCLPHTQPLCRCCESPGLWLAFRHLHHPNSHLSLLT